MEERGREGHSVSHIWLHTHLRTPNGKAKGISMTMAVTHSIRKKTDKEMETQQLGGEAGQHPDILH